MNVLVTGAAGFIGYHTVKRLIDEGHNVVGVDNINDYYNVNLKYARLAELGIYSSDEVAFLGGENRTYQRIEFHKPLVSRTYGNYIFCRANLEDKEFIFSLFEKHSFTHVVNLAAQAGVRYSIENPDVYIQSNICGFLNILEACRHYPVKHFVYASSSSVYGANVKVPFSIEDRTDSPVSLYAATKKANELLAHTYSHLYKMKTTGLRFFTVYGPWGRPDMAPMLFADSISRNAPIKVFNNGDMERDFTYVDDIVDGVLQVVNALDTDEPPQTNYRLFNIGNSKPIKLLDFVETLEREFGKKAQKKMLPMQPGDVKRTWADTSSLEKAVSYKPRTNLESGIKHFVEWYKKYFHEKI